MIELNYYLCTLYDIECNNLRLSHIDELVITRSNEAFTRLRILLIGISLGV